MIHGSVFLVEILGLCLLIFGRGREAVIVVGTWCFIASVCRYEEGAKVSISCSFTSAACR